MNLNMLPFAQRRENGTFDAWATNATGDYANDCQTGRNYFDLLICQADAEGNPLLISHVLQSMIEKGKVTGIEVGFLHSLSVHVIPATT